jgi:antitoxin ParD1/3/4
MPTVTISLPDSLRKFVETQVETRGYGNVSEYFRGLLREAQERESEKRLERLLLEGLDSGEDIELTPRYWSKKREAILAGVERRAKKRKVK